MSAGEIPFDSEAGYRAAIALTITAAQRELRIFDRDLAGMGLDLREQADTLSRFLAGDVARRLLVAVHDPAHLQTHLPRLLETLRSFAHQVEVRVTPDHLRHVAECWVLADKSGGTLRFHIDHARGKQMIAAPEVVAPWWRRADELWAECLPCTPWAVTGL